LVLALAACAPSSDDDSDTAESAPDAIVETGVIVADGQATQTAEVSENSIKLTGPSADKYQSTLVPGSIFVAARGGSKNPDGFLRRVVSMSRAGGDLVVNTKPATLTDAIVSGAMNATSGTKPLDMNSELHIDSPSTKSFDTIEIDFADKPLFDNIDDIDGVKFHELIKLDRALLSSRPFVNVDMRIADRKVTRFTALVQGNLDTSVSASGSVTADGAFDAKTLAALKAKKHQVQRVIYQSPNVPLPTISIGRVPVSPAVKFTVTLQCDLAFGGLFSAKAGVEAKSYVRLGGVLENGAWQAPIKSSFDIKPTFAIDTPGEVDAKCAIVTEAELSAYGTAGVSMTVAPYVDFSVSADEASRGGLPHGYFSFVVDAGADGSMHGKNDIFGLAASDLEHSLVQWKTSTPLKGHTH
jgi:hypothetical protein